MKITTKSRYAIRAIYALCMLGGDKHPVSILKILEFEDISKKYLEQIFTEGDCSNFSSCAVNWLWAGLEKACDDYLEKITIADMMKQSVAHFTV